MHLQNSYDAGQGVKNVGKKCDKLDLKKHVVKDRTTWTSTKKYIYKIVEIALKNIDQFSLRGIILIWKKKLMSKKNKW